MTRTLLLILGLSFLVACESGGEDVLKDTPDTEDPADPDNPDETPIDSDRELPPGTEQPSPETQIVRREAINDQGGGYARDIRYVNDEGQDQFIVDNLAFDGDNVYNRGGTATSVNSVGQLGPFAVYEAAPSTRDPDTGNIVDTFTYRAVYGRSETGRSEFAIVRTGSYIDYGFGGFIYQRNSRDFDGNTVSLVLPDEGDAQYLGDYAGIRVFEGNSGLEYVSGEAEMFIDFKDFNDGQRGVVLFVRNRRIFDIAGNDVTLDYLSALSDGGDGGTVGGEGDPGRNLVVTVDDDNNPTLPNLVSVISPQNADTNGEITGSIFERAAFDDGTTESTMEGNYYGILSGEGADEIVGVLVVEGDDPRVDGASVQETGGFIVYRE